MMPNAKAPQVEEGYTRIANELLEAIIGFGFTAHQLIVMLTLIRKTYGYQKKGDDISLSQLEKLCKLPRSHISTALKKLQAMNVIFKKSGKYGTDLAINKDYSAWNKEGSANLPTFCDASSVTESVTPAIKLILVASNESAVTETVTPKGLQNLEQGVTESVTGAVTESVTTKENLPKENQQKKTLCASALRERFARFYAAYPRKKSRAKAEQAFAKLNPSEQLLTTMLDAIERAKASGQWDDLQFVPYPASWLNAASWEDDLQTAFTEAERAVIDAFNASLGDQLGAIDLAIFSQKRASAIRAFLGLSDKPEFWLRFFPWVRDNTTLPPHVGFDWLISRDGFSKVKGGQFTRKDNA